MKHEGFGLVFFLFGVLPALQFEHRSEPCYASLACVGMSVAFAVVLSAFPGLRLRAAILACVFAISIVTNIHFRATRTSHVGRFSPIARRAINDLRPALAEAPRGTTARIVTEDRYLSGALYSGLGIKVFFPTVETVLFDESMPDGEPQDGETIFLHADGRLAVVR